jgi:hypothetical protein
MAWTEKQIRTFWRTKYPRFFTMYIFLFGILRGLLVKSDPVFALNLMMVAAFTSFIFLYIFYLYGVKPDELNDARKKYVKHKSKK